MIQISFQQI